MRFACDVSASCEGNQALLRRFSISGPRFLFWLGLEPVIFETDPDLIKEVFSSDHKGAFAKFGPQTALSKKVTGDALFALNGTKWLHRRRAVRPVFQGEQLQVIVNTENSASMNFGSVVYCTYS